MAETRQKWGQISRICEWCVHIRACTQQTIGDSCCSHKCSDISARPLSSLLSQLPPSPHFLFCPLIQISWFISLCSVASSNVDTKKWWITSLKTLLYSTGKISTVGPQIHLCPNNPLSHLCLFPLADLGFTYQSTFGEITSAGTGPSNLSAAKSSSQGVKRFLYFSVSTRLLLWWPIFHRSRHDAMSSLMYKRCHIKWECL